MKGKNICRNIEKKWVEILTWLKIKNKDIKENFVAINRIKK